MFRPQFFTTDWLVIAKVSRDREGQSLMVRLLPQYRTRSAHHIFRILLPKCNCNQTHRYEKTVNKNDCQLMPYQNIELRNHFVFLIMIGLLTKARQLVSNITKRSVQYSFEAASAQTVQKQRQYFGSTDQLLVTPNLIAVADQGSQIRGKYRADLEDLFTSSILTNMEGLFQYQIKKYCQDIYQLVSDSVSATQQEGSCSLAVATMHPDTGDISFYYIGDSLYGIFKQDKVQMVHGLYDDFHEGQCVGYQCDYTPSSGFIDTYAKEAYSKRDLIVLGTNGLWDNVKLDILHYELRGPGSFRHQTNKYPDAVGQPDKEPRSITQMAARIGKVAQICSRKGNYESPVYLRAQSKNVQYPKQGFLDDISIIVARRKKVVSIQESADIPNITYQNQSQGQIQ